MQIVSKPKLVVSINEGVNPETFNEKKTSLPSSGIAPPVPEKVWENIVLEKNKNATRGSVFFISEKISELN